MAGLLSSNRSSTSLITASITSLSLAQAQSVDAHLAQFVHLEIVNTLIASAATSSARRAQKERLAKDKPRFPAAPPPALSSSASASPQSAPSETHILDLVKFVCKDVWIALYDKQVDNLRTNHRGVYVLVDNAFKPLAKVSAVKGEKEAEEEVQRFVRFFLAFPSGVIRGALANLGVACTVTAESAAVPQSTFQIKTIKPGAV
ncbi:hypothetical protein RQP46_008171 [Phenoliferia psychrophenolica]